MAGAHLPPTVFNGQVTFNDRIILNQGTSGRECIQMHGGNGIFNIMQTFDHNGNPLHVIPTVGGPKVFGDSESTYPPGDVFNASARLMASTGDHLASTAGGIQMGHLTGQGILFFGIGVPNATNPVTTGVPANGSLYFRFDASGALTTLYQVQTGAWVGIL